MSGNPFRRAQGPQPGNEPAPVEEQAAPAHPNPLRSKRKKKRVTIQTPPRSPEDPPRRPSLGRISPPPPLAPAIRPDEEESDSATEADAKLREASLNARRNSDARPPLPPTTTTGAPYNPFARTLATSEASYGPRPGLQQDSDSKDDGYGKIRSNNAPAGMDVDTFKNILLTGNAPPSQSNASQSSSGVENSNKDDDRVLQSASIPAGRPSEIDFSGTSFDDLESASEESEEEDTETSEDDEDQRVTNNSTAAAPSRAETTKPRGPQVVSFDDFNESYQADPPPSSTSNEQPVPIDRSAAGILEEERKEPNRNKHPTTPYDADRSNQGTNATARDSHTTGTMPDLPPKKGAPPPPTSRRQGQATRTRSTSNATQNSAQDETAQSSKSDDKAPPPPPSRKPRPVSHSPSPTPPPPSQPASNNVPPPPPRRALNRSTDSGSNTPTSASTSISGQRASPPHNLPPAPPPRRGGTNHRSTAENSGASSTTANSISEGIDTPNDILADMSAFQAEIDALRLKASGKD